MSVFLPRNRKPTSPTPINGNSPQAKGLVAYYPILQSDGLRIKNLGTNGVNAVALNSPKKISCDSGSALLFNGSNTKLTATGVAGQFGLGSVSFSSRVKFNAIGTGDNSNLCQRDTDASSWGFQALLNGSNLRLYIVNQAPAAVSLTGTRALTTGVWYTLTVTYNLATQTGCVYVNGRLDATGTLAATSIRGPGSLFTIGATEGTIRPLNGAMEDIRLYNRVLSAAEVQDIHQNKLGLFQSANYPIESAALGTVYTQVCSAIVSTYGSASTLSVHTYQQTGVASATSSASFSSIKLTAPTFVPFTTPGATSWTVPAGVSAIIVEGIGGGQSGNAIAGQGGTGGWGGGYAKTTLSVTPGDTIYLNVGQGGAGTASYIVYSTVNGTNSWANLNTNSAPSVATTGMVAAANGSTSIGTTTYTGGPSTAGSTTMGSGDAADRYAGGAGGGAAGSAGNGSAGSIATLASLGAGSHGTGNLLNSAAPGNGGGGCYVGGVSGVAGSAYGGGGGGAGSWNSGTSGWGVGGGGNGIVVISYYASTGTTYNQSALASSSSSATRPSWNIGAIRKATPTSTVTRPGWNISSTKSVNSTSVPALFKQTQMTKTASVIASANALARRAALLTVAAYSAVTSTIQRAVQSVKSTAVGSTANTSKAALLNRSVIVNNSPTLIKTGFIIKNLTVASTSAITKQAKLSYSVVSTSVANIVKSALKKFASTATSASTFTYSFISGMLYIVAAATSNVSASLTKSISKVWNASYTSSATISKKVSTTKSVISVTQASMSKVANLIRSAISTTTAYKSELTELVLEVSVYTFATIHRAIATTKSVTVSATAQLNKIAALSFSAMSAVTTNLSKLINVVRAATSTSSVRFTKAFAIIRGVLSDTSAIISKAISTTKVAVAINIGAAVTRYLSIVTILISYFVSIKGAVVREKVVVTENNAVKLSDPVEHTLVRMPTVEHTVVRIDDYQEPPSVI
jgi:hypothetical protein